MKQKHLKPVFHDCTAGFALFQEQCLVRIIYEVVQKVMAVHAVIWQIGTSVDMRIHPKRGAVDYYIVLMYDIWGDILILYGIRTLISADLQCLQPELLKAVLNCF